MGNVLKLFKKRKKEERIVMVGLDNAGKTTILYSLKFGKMMETTPTIGFNCETIKYNNIYFAGEKKKKKNSLI